MTQQEKNKVIQGCAFLLQTLDPNLPSKEADKLVAKAIKYLYKHLLTENVSISITADRWVTFKGMNPIDPTLDPCQCFYTLKIIKN